MTECNNLLYSLTCFFISTLPSARWVFGTFTLCSSLCRVTKPCHSNEVSSSISSTKFWKKNHTHIKVSHFQSLTTLLEREALKDTCLSVCLSACLSICKSICLFVSISIRLLFVCLSVCLAVCLSACLSVCLSACLSGYPYICLSVCLSVCLTGRLPVFLSVCLYVLLS